MSAQNPKGACACVGLSIAAYHADFLRETFEDARAGVCAELREYPDRVSDPERLRREAVAYSRLLTALEERAIVPDAATREVVADLARAIDRGNEYARVVAEHEALQGLLVQLADSRQG
jgi:hypothetical protein